MEKNPTIVSSNIFRKKKQFMRLCAVAMVEDGEIKDKEQILLDSIYNRIFNDTEGNDIINSLKKEFPDAGDSPSILYAHLLCADQSMRRSIFMNIEALEEEDIITELKDVMQVINADDSVTDREREAFRIICKVFKIRNSRKLWNMLYNLSQEELMQINIKLKRKKLVDVNDFKTIRKAIEFYHIQGPIVDGIYHVLQRELTFEREYIFRNDKKRYRHSLMGFITTAIIIYLFVSFHDQVPSANECHLAHLFVQICLSLCIPIMMISIEWLIFMLEEYVLKRHKKDIKENSGQKGDDKPTQHHSSSILVILVAAAIIADVCIGIIELNGELTASGITTKVAAALFLGCVCFFIGKFIDMHRVQKSIDVDDMSEVLDKIEKHLKND